MTLFFTFRIDPNIEPLQVTFFFDNPTAVEFTKKATMTLVDYTSQVREKSESSKPLIRRFSSPPSLSTRLAVSSDSSLASASSPSSSSFIGSPSSYAKTPPRNTGATREPTNKVCYYVLNLFRICLSLYRRDRVNKTGQIALFDSNFHIYLFFKSERERVLDLTSCFCT